MVHPTTGTPSPQPLPVETSGVQAQWGSGSLRGPLEPPLGQRVKLHYKAQPQGRVPPKFRIVICGDATPFGEGKCPPPPPKNRIQEMGVWHNVLFHNTRGATNACTWHLQGGTCTRGRLVCYGIISTGDLSPLTPTFRTAYAGGVD